MPGPSFKAFDKNGDHQQLKVLTLAAMYPSKVQPWMINHLYQIEQNGGQNRIISVETEDYTFDEALADFDFANYYWHMGSERKEQLVNAVKQLREPQILKNTCKLLSQSSWPDSIKKKVRHGLNAYSFTLKPDVIHSHSEIAGSRFLSLIEANGAPLVHTFHGQTPVGVPSISTEARLRYSQAARAILVNTQFAKRQYEALGAKNSNFVIIPQGIDLSQWDFAPLPPPVKGEPLHILTVGRIVEEKGHKYVIEALKLLTEKGVNACYHIVGRGPELSNLQQQTKALGLTNKVIFHGVLTGQALKQQYAQSHIFVLPSLKGDGQLWEETQGVVVQEAQASGRLVIGADSGGIPESIVDGENGFIVPDREPNALVHKIIDIVNAPEKWQAWQQAGRNWTQSHYDLKVVGARVYDVYKNL
ncbi:glycosyltransferase family 4 protein [Salinimonas marina]|uniref:Glycosyltransferase family 4 protein n=1 Tax=Salinimonas marina TaxID=2785918 RepID=A0A7S9HDN3_9ALTE|nr:glycosyltransferase family 4 protein [Salinimonas marina]QPG06395.1 glycosyltransferase family 4 protein [Salinimonas marina]